VPLSQTNERGPTAWERITSLYLFFKAEQPNTQGPRATEFSERLLSQGRRSSSVKGVPLCIFLMFDSGWKWSPSRNSRPSLEASSCPTVVFPHPETPITTNDMSRVVYLASETHTRDHVHETHSWNQPRDVFFQ